MFLFASQPSSRSISVSRREPGGLRWEHKGKQTPTMPLQPPFLHQAGRNELLNGVAAAHGKTCVNRVGVKITAEVHSAKAKRRRASFMRVKFAAKQTQKIICSVALCTRCTFAPDVLGLEQPRMATGRHGNVVIPLSPTPAEPWSPPLWLLLGHWLQQSACSAVAAARRGVSWARHETAHPADCTQFTRAQHTEEHQGCREIWSVSTCKDSQTVRGVQQFIRWVVCVGGYSKS